MGRGMGTDTTRDIWHFFSQVTISVIHSAPFAPVGGAHGSVPATLETGHLIGAQGADQILVELAKIEKLSRQLRASYHRRRKTFGLPVFPPHRPPAAEAFATAAFAYSVALRYARIERVLGATFRISVQEQSPSEGIGAAMAVADAPEFMGVPLKHISLITLIFQNSAHILIMHYSRVMPAMGGHRYFTSTAVFLNEIFKLAVSLSIAMYDISRTLPPSTPATVLFEQLYMSVFSGDGWKLAIPAILYTLQNSLQYVAISNLDAVHFQILYQLKILTTALFSVTMLGRTLSSRRWIALVFLTLGVSIVQMPASDSSVYSGMKDPDHRFYFPRSFHELGQVSNGAMDVAVELTKRGMNDFSQGIMKRSATYEGIEEDLGLVKPVMNYSIGLAAVMTAAVISGLTGVYFEKVLKESNTHVTVWTRNIQLSFYSLFPALIFGVIIKDGEEIAKNGFFDGYNATVWTAIIFQAFGGVLVAMCITYADNIAKNFATSISIVMSFVFSVWFFDFQVSWRFVIGTAVVIFATYLYSGIDRKRNRPPPINIASYEKTTIDHGYTPKYEEDRSQMTLAPLDGLKAAGLSTSRPSSPMRHHSRVGSSRGKIKRED